MWIWNDDVGTQWIGKMEGTVFAPALEGFKTVKSDAGEILTKPFLEVCKQILPVIGSSILSSLFCFDPKLL